MMTNTRDTAFTGIQTLSGSVLDSLPQHITVIDEQARIIYVNQAWKSFADTNGLNSPDYCLGTNYLKTVQTEGESDSPEAGQIRQELPLLLQGELDCFAVDYPCHSPDKQRWFKARFNCLAVEGRRLATVSHENITHLWQTRRNLLENEYKLQSMVAAIPDPICMIDRSMSVVWSNDRAKDLFGQAMEGKGCRQVYGSSCRDGKDCIVRRTFSDSRLHTGEYHHQDVSGQNRIFQCRSSVAGYDEAGMPSLVLEILEDITEHKTMVRQLQSAKDQAESAIRAKNHFLATMSHEIRTPMNAILGMSRLMQETRLNKTQQTYISSIFNGADALLSIINNILDLARLEAEKIEVVKKEFELGSLIDNIIRVLTYTAREKRLALIRRETHPLPLYLIGDAPRITQIVMNLITNALKYTSRGHVTITSKIDPKENDRGTLTLSVTDTGIGISKEQMEGLFQPFSQLDGSPSRKADGTGLGLVISQKMAERMDGRIQVESEPGKGSTFTLTLPLEISHMATLSDPPDAKSCMDWQKGLAYVGNKKKVYVKMLQTFEKSYRDFHLQILSALKEADRKEAAFLMHKLKSTAAMIGADRLSRLSQDLEKKCKAGIPADGGRNDHGTPPFSAIQKQAEQVTRELTQVCEAIRTRICFQTETVLSDEEEPKTLDLDEIQDVKPLLKELIGHIRSHRPVESMALLKKVLSQSGKDNYQAFFLGTEKLIKSYRFQLAEQRLNRTFSFLQEEY